MQDKEGKSGEVMELGNIQVGEDMVVVNLWVTMECNYACTYCYENGKKELCYLGFDSADKIVEFIHKQCELENRNILWINFHGGEPMLNWPVIKYIVEAFDRGGIVKKLFTSMTTNCSIYDDSIFEYICELSVSIDGTKESHDENRVTKSGCGTYDRSIENALKYLKKKPDLRVRTVVTPKNVSKLYENVVHLLELGFRVISPGVDFFDASWEYEHFDELYKQTMMIKTYIEDEKNKFYGAHISLLSENMFEKGKCKVGCEGYQIDADGKLYPCTYVVREKEYCIGDVENGFDDKKIKEFNSISDNKVNGCEGCANYKYCDTPRCLVLNKQLMGDYCIPSPVVCAYENFKLRVCGLL